jgi:imidazolonepropionase-like amidohydrolase
MKVCLIGGQEAGEVLESLAEAKLPLLFGPFDFNTHPRVLRTPAAAHAAGIPVGFTAKSPFRDPAHLRLSAALAVREGLDKQAALRAITSGAAAIGGIDGRVGSLGPGLDADIAVFSRHPLDLDARLLRLYVSGSEVPVQQGDGS